MNKKFTSTLAGAFIFITILNLFSRGLGFLREVLFANYFGRGIEFDVYLLGAVIPITINIIAIVIGQNYFIPSYHKIKSTNSNSIKKLFTINFILFIFIGITIAAILFFFSETIITAYLDTNDESIIEVAISIFRLFLITIPFAFAISILTAFEQAKYKFKYPAIGRLLLNSTLIPILFIFTDKFGIYTIPIGFISGILIQFIYLLFKSSARKNFSFLSFSDRKNFFEFLDITLISIILVETIVQVYALSDRFFFNDVDRGGIASLSYASNLFNLPVSVVSLALGTVIFPKISENIQTKSFDNLQQNLLDFIRANLLFFVPIAFVFFFYGDILIKLLFERGKFSSSDTLYTYMVLKVYAFSLIFYSTHTILNKILYGAKLVNLLLIITVAGIAIKIVLNFVFVDLWKQNGLALSTSISYIFFFSISFILVHKKLPLKNHNVFISEFSFHVLNGIITYLIITTIFYPIIINNIIIDLIKIILFVMIYIFNIVFLGNKSLIVVKKLMNSLKPVKSLE